MEAGAVPGEQQERLDRLDREVANDDRPPACEESRVGLVQSAEASHRCDRAAERRLLLEPVEDLLHGAQATRSSPAAIAARRDESDRQVRILALLSRLLRSPRLPRADAPPADAPALPEASVDYTDLPAWPFAVATTADGQTAFVSMPREGHRGVVALTRGSPWTLAGSVWLSDGAVPRGLVVTRDARWLLVADSSGALLVLDARALAAGETDPMVVRAREPSHGIGSMTLALHPSERWAFLSDEDSASLSVFDCGELPAARYIGKISVPDAPVGVTCSPDGEMLLLTSQAGGRGRGNGLLSAVPVAGVIDCASGVLRSSGLRSVEAGASPVRVVIATDGKLAWVSARGGNAVVAFDTAAVLSGAGGRALQAVVQVGVAPVGLALLHSGRRLVAANSNRYAADRGEPQSLSVVDTDAALGGRPALLGTVPARSWPRELAALPDDRTLLVTNVLSRTLETVTVC
jgi:DNA-binding beta-propeller fold protein YncE